MADKLSARNFKPDQSKVIKDVHADLDRALADARKRLSDVGIDRDTEQGSFCFLCQCPGFTAKIPDGLTLGGGDHPSNPCMRLGCGHAFMRHYVY